MPTIPPELLPVLKALGIIDPAGSPWRRAEAWPARRVRAHVYCACAASVRVELQYATLGSRRVFIGQCERCRTVCWREAVAESRR